MTGRLLVLAFVLLVAACGSDESGENSGSAREGPEITLTEFALDPASVTVDDTGKTTFRVVNDGETTHALEIEGKGVDGAEVEEETDLLKPGASAELTVDLDEGEYELYCPVENHRGQGMEGTLAVGAGATESPPGETDRDQDTDEDDPYGG